MGNISFNSTSYRFLLPNMSLMPWPNLESGEWGMEYPAKRGLWSLLRGLWGEGWTMSTSCQWEANCLGSKVLEERGWMRHSSTPKNRIIWKEHRYKAVKQLVLYGYYPLAPLFMVSYDLTCQPKNSDKDQWRITYFPRGVPTPKRRGSNLLFSQMFLKSTWKCRKLSWGHLKFVYIDPLLEHYKIFQLKGDMSALCCGQARFVEFHDVITNQMLPDNTAKLSNYFI